MKIKSLAVVACMFAATTAVAQDRKPAAESKPAAKAMKVGDVIDGAVKLRDLDGKERTFDELRGKIVVVAFWSKECPYMKPAEPKLKALHAAWQDKDVVLFGVCANKGELGADPYAAKDKPKETYTAIRAHLKSADVKFTIIADHGNKFADLLAAQSTPHCFVFDKTGALRYAGALDDDGGDKKGKDATPYVKQAVEALQKGEAPKTTSTKPYGCGIKREG